jgi:hypothetical protein
LEKSCPRLGAAAGVQFAILTENAELSAANSELAVQLGTFNGCAVDHPTTRRTAQVT